ncbi:substrate-binding domain-containing protein [Robinsoniella sp. KNHs210]|uniref:substrate-binding domain-containing protein n=1 Tax=Robinsoniella sp. KNHs210 TaxID=1469950 RepID=UPI001FA7E19A|nr:substrate-binding domain-containing protein [Robinsoniella sp. KNHs210]
MLIPDAGDYFWGPLCGYIEEALQKHNYSTIISSYNPQLTESSEELRFLISSQIDGVLFVPRDEASCNLAILMRNSNIPFVYLDQLFENPSSDAVTSSNYKAAFDIMEYLINHGHNRIGIISGNYNSYTIKERFEGCKNAYLKHGFPEKDLLFLSGKFSAASGAKLFKKMISVPNPPTAIFMLGCNLTLGAILELNNLGLSLPNDLSLVSFDDDQIFHAFDPPITSMVQDFSEIATQAVDLLLRRISGDCEGFPETKMIPTHFIERSSVKAI